MRLEKFYNIFAKAPFSYFFTFSSYFFTTDYKVCKIINFKA